MMRKRILLVPILAIALLLSACAQTAEPAAPAEPVAEAPAQVEASASEETAMIEAVLTPEELPGLQTVTLSKPEIERAVPSGVITSVENMPRIDGSTACIPLMQTMLEHACGLSMRDAEPYYDASGTQHCWNRLYISEVDMVLAYEIPAQTDQSFSRSALDLTPIGRDALVFLVNERNPITNLTQRQLIDIYTGKITNWAQLGGADEEIFPIQRDESSGSQTLFRKLLMKDVEPMEPPLEYRIGSMDYLVEEIAGYDNSMNDIGFSVYYYVSQMKNEPGVRVLSVDGVMPTNETIASGAYPLTNDFFAAVRADEPENSGARILYNWICGDEGRQCLIDAGYVPAE